MVRYLDGGHVDGALVVGMHGRRPLDLDWLDIPVVFGGRPVCAGEPGRFSYVDVDNRAARSGPPSACSTRAAAPWRPSPGRRT